MDNRRERLEAGMLGGAGTLVGLMIYQAIPDLVRFDHLEVRIPNALLFLVVIFTVGSTGGFVGHLLFLRIVRGPIEGRAIVVGASVGFAIAAVGWTVTYALRGSLFPFHPFEGMEDLMRVWLLNALLAGPIGGVLAALAVVKRLRRLSGQHEPLEAPRGP